MPASPPYRLQILNCRLRWKPDIYNGAFQKHRSTLLLSTAAPSLCTPVDDKIDIKVEIKIDSGNDGDFALGSHSWSAPRLGGAPAVDQGLHVAGKLIPTSDPIVTIDGNFTLRVGAFPVGASSEEYYPGWFPFSILDTGSSTANFTLVDGVLSQDHDAVMRFFQEDLWLAPKLLYVNKSQRNYPPTRWMVSGKGDRRTLGYMDGGDGKYKCPKTRKFVSAKCSMPEKVLASETTPGGDILFPLLRENV